MWHGNITVDLHEPFIQQIIRGPQTMTYTLNKQWHFSFLHWTITPGVHISCSIYLSIPKHLVQGEAPELK